MRKKIIACSLAAAFLLTGCGAKEQQLWKQAQNPDYKFIDTEQEVNDIMEKAENVKTAVSLSQEMAEELQQLEEALKEPVAKGLISEMKSYSEDEDDYDEYEYDGYDYNEYEEDEDSTQTISGFNEKYRKGESKIGSVSGDYTASSEKKLREALALLEQSGYTGICDLVDNYNTDEYTNTMKMIHGIQFSAYHEEGTESWDFSIHVSEDQLCRAKSIDDFMKANVDDCFTIDGSISGGYIERLKLLGDQGLLNQDFSSTFIIDTHENKTIRLAVRMQANKKQVSGKAFSEEQQQTVIRLLSQVTGDEKASEEFVKNLELETNDKGQPVTRSISGKIGSATYKLQSEAVYYDMYYNDGFAAFILVVE